MSQKKLGPLGQKEAERYMEQTRDLVIVDVATKRWYNCEHFTGAVHIPIEEICETEQERLYLELPRGRPVILHCRMGMIVPAAYRKLISLRPDIPEISYIDGAPLFKEYNRWQAQHLTDQ